MAQKTGFIRSTLARLGFAPAQVADLALEVERAGFNYGEQITTASLLGSAVVQARVRQQIYQKYQEMQADPVVGTALRLHVTAALGGHETSGALVFLEAKPKFKKDDQVKGLVQEAADDLSDMLNEHATLLAYNGAAFGDAYARLYPKNGKGITKMLCDEMLLPPLVQPYEQGGETRVCVVGTGQRYRQPLVMNQIARLRMPRMQYTPQPVAVEKAWRAAVETDEPDDLPLMPALVGGSFLADAESQFDSFRSSLLGLVGQRILDSIDESVFTLQVQGLTKEQRDKYKANVAAMFEKSKRLAEDAVKSGKPLLARIRHIIPVFGDKQLMQAQALNAGGGTGQGRAGNIGFEDVLFQAKLLCGALGTDITMVGFADLMSGGLGEGGFFRTSAQTAERSRNIRVALALCYDEIVALHVFYKKGIWYPRGQRPWQVNFFGSMSALEAERAKTLLDALAAGQQLAMVLQQLKDGGMDGAAMTNFLEKMCRLDAEDAKMYADAIVAARKEDKAKEAMQNGFGPGGEPLPGGDEPTGEGPVRDGGATPGVGTRMTLNPRERVVQD